MSIYRDILKRHQRQTVQRTLRRFDGKALLALDMGLGKTVISLSIMQQLEAKTLIICPASLKYNWVAEFEKFLPDASPYICNGRTPPKSTLSKVDVFICNYEILQYWKGFFLECGLKLMVADESHYIKEKTAKRTKAAMLLANYIPYKVLLTGTPIENKPVELWSQLAIINKTFFPSWLLFAKKFNGAIRDNYGWRMTRATNTKELHDFLTQKCMIRMRKEDVLDLPPIVRQVIPLQIKNRKEYEAAEDDIIAWLRRSASKLDLEKTRKAQAQVKLDKLKLIAAKGKLAEVIDWVNENSPNFKIVLFCYHREILFELHEKIRNHVFVPSEVRGVDRQNAVKKFQTDENCRVFLTTIRVGNAGFNLTASNTTVFVQEDWSASKHDQAEARVHRMGQEASSVNAIYFFAKDTIEERLIRLIDTKRVDCMAVIDGKEVEENSLLTDILKDLIKKERQNERKQPTRR